MNGRLICNFRQTIRICQHVQRCYPWSRQAISPPKMGILIGVLLNIVLLYCICYHNVLTRATIEQHAKLYQHDMKNVLVRHLGHGNMQLVWLNPLCAKRFRGSINMYLHLLSFLHTDMTQVVEILSWCKTRTCLFYIVNIMGADVLVTQGARASATMILT